MTLLKNFMIKASLLLFRILPPELSSYLSLNSIRILNKINKNILTYYSESPISSKLNVAGLDFKHCIGLSAGIDKEGKYFNSLGSMGFSFVEVGTFTPHPQNGNDHPRIKRITENRSLINRLGFNNPGILRGLHNIKRNRSDYSGVLGISVGKNKATKLDEAFKDYNFCIEKCFPVADYIAVNISSPNTDDLRKLTSPDYIFDLTNEIRKKMKQLEKIHNKKVPIFLKLSPDEENQNIQKIISTSLSNDFNGFIVSNTTKGYLKGISGGISGELLKEKSNQMLIDVKKFLGEEAALIASGGISSKKDVEERMDNGADLLQIYTSFIYKGPSILEELLI